MQLDQCGGLVVVGALRHGRIDDQGVLGLGSVIGRVGYDESDRDGVSSRRKAGEDAGLAQDEVLRKSGLGGPGVAFAAASAGGEGEAVVRVGVADGQGAGCGDGQLRADNERE